MAHTVFQLPRAATLFMQRAGSMGNTDRQQFDSRASDEGKGTACIKKLGGTAGSEMGRQTGREREGTVRETDVGKQGAPSPQPLLIFGQEPAPPSIALREMERKGKDGGRGEL